MENHLKQFYPRPLWFWNGTPNEESIGREMREGRDSACGGFGILPYDGCGLHYLERDYMSAYRTVLETAKKLGMRMCLYDEWGFPSGNAGGLLKEKYPEAVVKRLDRLEAVFEGKDTAEFRIGGELQAVAAIDRRTREVLVPEYSLDGHLLTVRFPEPRFVLLAFDCVTDDWDRVDYLDPESVGRFIELTHEAYYREFSEYFGNVVDTAFYDEPQFYGRYQNPTGRMWTPKFNAEHEARFGKAEAKDYVALWEDVGADTDSRRIRMFGLRAELFSLGFVKTIADWCTAHGIELTGHIDQEEVVNCGPITGDVIESFRYQQIPGVDCIFQLRRSRQIFRLISSAADQFDREKVMAECFGAMGNLPLEDLWCETMEMFAKGINYLVPHAVWLDKETVPEGMRPELSSESPIYGGGISDFNLGISRLASHLIGGRHVSEVALLYPIHDLQSAYFFGEEGNPYLGGHSEAYMNYLEVGEALSDAARDFTFLHPRALDEQCRLTDGVLHLDNEVNFADFKAVVLPGMRVISLSNLKKIAEFAAAGGTVLFAGRLPDSAASSNQKDSEEIRRIVSEMLGRSNVRSERNPKRAAAALEALVDFETVMSFEPVESGFVSCMHKARTDGDVWLFVNATKNPVSAAAKLPAIGAATVIDPMSAEEFRAVLVALADGVRFEMQLEPKSCILLKENR